MRKIFFFSLIILAVVLIACGKEEVSELQPTVEEQPAPAEQAQPAAGENVTAPAETPAAAANVSAGPVCVDSDNGLNTQLAGDVVDKTGKRYEDTCEDTKTLLERKCAKDGNIATSRVTCLQGCKDGACIPPPVEETTESSSETPAETPTSSGSTAHCTDTDGGRNFDSLGICADAQTKNLKDTCIGSDTLIEWFCSTSQDKCVQEEHDCDCVAGYCQ